MKLWVFNRFNLYNLKEFNIYEKLKKFIEVIVKYVIMNDEELRLDTFIELNDIDRFITISKNAIEKKNKMQLNEMLFVKQRAIVC